MVNTTMLSNYDYIRYNGKLSPILELDYDIPQETSYHVTKSNNFGSETGQVQEDGSLKFNKYKRDHNKTILQRNKVTCHNRYLDSGKCSLNQLSKVIHRKASIIKTTEKRIDEDCINECCSQDESLWKAVRLQWDKEIATKTKNSREILSEISKNSTTAKNNPIDKLKLSFNLELDKTIETSDKRTKSKVNKYLKKGYHDNADRNLTCSGGKTVHNSKIKNRTSAIPKLKGNTSKESNTGSKRRHNYKLDDPDPSINTCCTNTKVSPDENKFEVQEIRSSNVISSKQCIPVNKYTGKKFVGGLNGINTITREDKTIPFNKGDVQNQRSATKNKYSRNIRANEPVTIKGRLSKTDITGTTLVTTIGNSGDIADSSKIDSGVSENDVVKLSNEDRVAIVDIEIKDLENSATDRIIEKGNQGRTKGDSKTSLKTENNSKDTESQISPLGCQYKFNDFTCVEITSNNDKSSGAKYTSDIKNDKNESITYEVKNVLKLEIKDKNDILKIKQECDSQHNPKVNTGVVSSKFITIQNTGNDGIMDTTVHSKCEKGLTIKNLQLSKHTLRNDKREKTTTREQVKTTGNIVRNTKGSIIPSRLPSNCAKRDSKLQEKAKLTLKDDKQANTDQSRSKSPAQNNILKGAAYKIENSQPGTRKTQLPSRKKTEQNPGRTKLHVLVESKTEARSSQNIDKNLSSNTGINNTCQSYLKKKIKGYNKQSGDKETTSEVKETCTGAKDTSIDCNTDSKTFASDRQSKCPKSNVKEDQNIDHHLQNDAEKHKTGCVEFSENLTSNDRLRNIGSIGSNNSGEIDHLSDGQNKADDRKVHQTALDELSNLYEFQSEKSISKHHEGSSENNFTFSTDQSQHKNQQNKTENILSAESVKDRKACTDSLELHNNNIGQYVIDNECASLSSSSILDTNVPKTIIDTNRMMGNNVKLKTSAKTIHQGKLKSNDMDHLELETYDITMDVNLEDGNYSQQKINYNTLTDNCDSSQDKMYENGILSSNKTDRKIEQQTLETESSQPKRDKNENTKPNNSEGQDIKVKQARKLLSPKVSTKRFTADNKKSITTTDKCVKDKQNEETVKHKDKIERTSTPKSQVSSMKHSKLNSASGKQSSIQRKYSTSSKTMDYSNEIPSKESSPCSDISNASITGSDLGARAKTKPNTANKGRTKTICKTSKIKAETLCTSQKETNISDSVVKTQVECCQSANESNRNLSTSKITNSKYTSSSNQLTDKKKSTKTRPSLESAKTTNKTSSKETVLQNSNDGKGKDSKSCNRAKTSLPVKRDIQLIPKCNAPASTRSKITKPSNARACNLATGTKTNVTVNNSNKRSSPLPSPSLPCKSRSNSIVSVSSDKQPSFVPFNMPSKSAEANSRSKPKTIPTSQIKAHGTKSPAVNKPRKPETLNLRQSIEIRSCTPSPTLSRSSRASSVASPTTTRSNIALRKSTRTINKGLNVSVKSTAPKAQNTPTSKLTLQRQNSSNSSSKSAPKCENKTRTSKLPVTKKTNVQDMVKQSPVRNTARPVDLKSNVNLHKIKSNQPDKTDKSLPGKDSIDEKQLICIKTDINAEILKTVCVPDKTDQVSSKDQIRAEAFDFCGAQNTTNSITNKQVREQVQDPFIEIVSVSDGKTIAPMDENNVHSSSESVGSDQYWSASDGDGENIDKSTKCKIEVPSKLNTQLHKMDLTTTETVNKTSGDVDNNEISNDHSANSHVHLHADDCSLQVFELAFKGDLLHNNIDRTYETETNSENSTSDCVEENISQQQKHDYATSDDFINTFLLHDSKETDKAQYVSIDCEENIFNHSDLEQDFNAKSDINEVNHSKLRLQYSSYIEEDHVKVVDVKNEKLSTSNIMEYQINQKTVSLDYHEVDPKSLNNQTENQHSDSEDADSVLLTAQFEYNGSDTESCELLVPINNLEQLIKIKKTDSTVQNNVLLTSTVAYVETDPDLNDKNKHAKKEETRDNEKHENVPLFVEVDHLDNSSTRSEEIIEDYKFLKSKQVGEPNNVSGDVKGGFDSINLFEKTENVNCTCGTCDLETNKGEIQEHDITDILGVRTLSIQGNSQFGAKTIHQNEEVSRGQNILILDQTNIRLDHPTETKIKRPQSSDRSINCSKSSKSQLHVSANEQYNRRNSSPEIRTARYDDLVSRNNIIECSNDSIRTSLSAKVSDFESDSSDNSMASSVQNSPSTRRPRRVFSKEERKLKYEQLTKRTKLETALFSPTETVHQTPVTKSNETVTVQNIKLEDYQTSYSQKIETKLSSLDKESKNISEACDSADFNPANRCKENSLINIGTDRLKHITDERNHKQGKHNLNEEATFTKIITDEHDIKLSNSQSQELELILSEKSGLSSAKRSVDSEEDASQDVVKRSLRPCTVTENRRAVNLDNVFHSEDGFSISVECTLNLESEKKEGEIENKTTETETFPTITCNIEETVNLCLHGDTKEEIEETFDLERLQTVSTENNSMLPGLTSSPDTQNHQRIYCRPSDKNMQDKTNNFDKTNFKYKLGTEEYYNSYDTEKTLCLSEKPINTIKIVENEDHQTPSNHNGRRPQLDSNLKLNTSTFLHSTDREQLRHDQNIFKFEVAVLDEKVVICTANNAMPCVETDKSSEGFYDETSEMYAENNKCPADRKHLMLDLSTKEKHNTAMHLTDNVKVASKNKARQHPRRLTDIIRYGEDENNAIKSDLKPRAKSKSPARCIVSPDTEKDQILHSGYGKVSEICRTFIQKTKDTSKTPNSPAESGKIIHAQSGVSSKQMKWARVEGVWQRIPVEDGISCAPETIRRVQSNATTKPNRRSAESLSQWKCLVDKIQKIQKEKRNLEDSESSPEEQNELTNNTGGETNTVTNNAAIVPNPQEVTMVTVTKQKTKPPPPKTLPKPKRYNRNELTEVTSVSIKRPNVNYEGNHISSSAGNAQNKHYNEKSNKDSDENKTTQVQQSVHIDKSEVQVEPINSKTSENKQENAITTKAICESERIDIIRNIGSPTAMEVQGDSKDDVKNERTMETDKGQNQTKDKESVLSAKMEYKEVTKPDIVLQTELQELQSSTDLQQKPSSCIESKLPRYTPARIRMMMKQENSFKQEKSPVKSQRNKTDKPNDNDGISKLVTMPIKQEVFPKEEDISSDIIAKVLKVMDSFSTETEDNVSEYSGVKFTIGSDDSSERENLSKHKDYNDQRNTRLAHPVHQHGNGRAETGSLLYRQPQLLSEISELEERNNDDILEDSNKNLTNKKTVKTSPCSTPSPAGNRSPCLQRSSFSRSHSLPTTALSHPGSRILYRDGSFVIEPDFPEEIDEIDETKSLDIENGNIHHVGNCNSLERDVNRNKSNYSVCRRSQSEADLCDVDSEDNLFLENEGDLTVIENGNIAASIQNTSLLLDEESTSLPSPVEDNCHGGKSMDSTRTRRLKKKKLSARRSRSFRDFSETEKPVVKLKRNLSFVEAVNDIERLKISDRNDSMQSIASTISMDESPQHDRKLSLDDTRTKSPGFLQKVFSRRKGSIDQGTKKKSQSKESVLRKMSLKTIFGAKKGKEQIEKCHIDEPQTPPIAAFQSDNDIHIIDSAPGSPYSSLRFKRRHTSAEIYDQSASSSSRSSLDILNNRSRGSRLEDQLGMRSLNSSSLSIAEQPLRPKSPKPNVTIVRRNSNLSLPSSPTGEVLFDMGGKPIDSMHRKHDSVDAARLIGGSNHNNDMPNQRPIKQFSGADLEKLASKLVQNDMTSSNSNDSGIQHDVSVHSSNESLKASPDGSVVPRRRKSPSPRPERPKSEISVRWADLVEHTDISPVKRREGSECRPRPKSDLEENLQLFDEMYEEVFDDYMYFTGGSSLNSDMKPFGSQGSLQLMYSSLQSLDSLRKHDPCDQKATKRRMSTPHPIKTRLSTRVPPPKQSKRSSLVRSHSMPESLDKLHRRRKLHSVIASSNLHDIYLRNFDDDSSSDDGSDISVDQISLTEKSLSARTSRAQLSTLDEMPESENRTYAEALWDHITMDPEELRFRAGDLIEVIDMNDKDWWYGALDDHQEGWLPATFVRLRVNQEHFDEDLISRFAEIPESSSPRRISMINPDQGRTNVIKEILQAEQDYVKHMKDVVEGYIRHARKRVDMFTEEKISVIFGNIEEIFRFSTQFLETLESAYCKEQPHQSELGKCFLKHSKEFEIYSDYCNNHPSGSAELKDLYRKQKYRHFFEACRLLQEMIEIPLEGFLLNPVQKICKYPLQLAELLKYTPSSHPDYHSVQQALDAMKKIAALINERKRKMESIEKLARWQHTVEDWQGRDLLEKSSELIYSSEINKINSAGWSQERWFYLFDHQLVYCKKDLLKRNGFSYKGRLDMDQCDVINIEDGKDVQYNVTVKNAWKIHETHKDKWYLLYAKTPAEKQRWLKAFQKEREKVREDQENNFIPDHWKRTILNRIKASQEKQNSRTVSELQYKQEFIRGIPSHATLPRSYSKKQSKRKGWFPFGGKQKTKT